MPRFTRPPGRPAGPTKINFAAAKKPVLLDPGLYRLQVERAEKVVGRNGNTSIALTLTDIASGQVVSIRPMWVDGPNARYGDLAERNQAVIADLLRLAGQPLDGDLMVQLKGLAGLRFIGDLGIETANPFNTLRGGEPIDPDEPVRHD